MTEQTDIGTLEQEVRQVRARLARVEGERDSLLAALEDIAQWTERYTQPGHPISTVARRAIARVKGSQ